MESYCGTDAVFIEKFGTVEAASRRKILKETQKLVNDSPTTKHLPIYIMKNCKKSSYLSLIGKKKDKKSYVNRGYPKKLLSFYRRNPAKIKF